LKFFPAGLTSDSEVIDYGGGRDASSLIRLRRVFLIGYFQLGKRIRRKI
jgi:hypothetical protein